MRCVALALLSLVACGGDSVRHIADAPKQGDGPNHDVEFDAPGVLPVTLTVSFGGVAQSGVHVYFQNADSTVVLATTTDPSGTASTVMAAGGYVTAVDPFPAQNTFQQPTIVPQDMLFTFAGVKPGDHLLLSHAESTVTTVDVTAEYNGGANRYSVATSCQDPNFTPPYRYTQDETIFSGSAQPATGAIDLYNCGATADVLVAAETVEGSPVGFVYAPTQAVTAALDVSAQDYSIPATRTYTYNNVPASIPLIRIEDTSVSAHGALYQSYGGATYGDVTYTGTLPVPTFTGASDLVEMDASTGPIPRQHFVDLGPYATTYATDIGARILPNVNALPTVDATTHAITWTEDAGGAAPDFVVASTSVVRDPSSWSWTIVAPRTGTSVVMPTLPTDLFDYNIGATDGTSVFGLLVAKVTGGYDAVRAGLLSSNASTDLITTPTGSLTYEDLPVLQAETPPQARRVGTPTHRLTNRRL